MRATERQKDRDGKECNFDLDGNAKEFHRVMKGFTKESFVGLRAMLIAGSVVRQANCARSTLPTGGVLIRRRMEYQL